MYRFKLQVSWLGNLQVAAVKQFTSIGEEIYKSTIYRHKINISVKLQASVEIKVQFRHNLQVSVR